MARVGKYWLGSKTSTRRLGRSILFKTLISTFMMVIIPAIGYFFIADILGGGKVMIVGDLIRNQFLSARK